MAPNHVVGVRPSDTAQCRLWDACDPERPLEREGWGREPRKPLSVPLPQSAWVLLSAPKAYSSATLGALQASVSQPRPHMSAEPCSCTRPLWNPLGATGRGMVGCLPRISGLLPEPEKTPCPGPPACLQPRPRQAQPAFLTVDDSNTKGEGMPAPSALQLMTDTPELTEAAYPRVSTNVTALVAWGSC